MTDHILDSAADAGTVVARGFRAQTLVTFVRLKWFIHLRWIMLLVCAAALAIDRAYAGGPVRPLRLYQALALLAVVNLLWVMVTELLSWRMRRASLHAASALAAATVLANAQISVDLFFLTVLIRYTGGVESPLAVFYAFHMIIAAMLLSRPNVVFQALWAVVLYVGMAVGELQGGLTPHYAFLPWMPQHGRHGTPEFVALAVLLTVSGITGILYFATRIVQRADSHERALERLNAALQSSRAKMAELQTRKTQFMRTAAHQLKSPLAAVQTQLSLLRDGLVPAEQIPDQYEAMIGRCRAGIDQVVDLLTFARVQDLSDGRAAAEPVDAAATAREVCNRLSLMALHKSIRLNCDAPMASACAVFVHPADLADCLTNLVDNAIKYTPENGEVSVRVARVEASVEVQVRDTGMGMTEATRRRLGEPYMRGSEAIAAGICGTGLGMSIAHAVVERAGGSLHVESRVGEGTVFRLVFPGRPRTEKSPS